MPRAVDTAVVDAVATHPTTVAKKAQAVKPTKRRTNAIILETHGTIFDSETNYRHASQRDLQ